MSEDKSYLQRFVVEAREHLAGMTAALIALERGEDDPRAHIERLLRSSHSIKGGAGFSGRRRIEQLAHAMEAALENLRDGRAATTPQAIDALLAALDRVSGMIDDAEHSEETDIAEPLARLAPLLESGSLSPPALSSAPTTAVALVAAAVDASGAQQREFPLTDLVRSSPRAENSTLYGVKFDWRACERDFQLAPLEIAARLERAGTVLDSRCDVGLSSLARRFGQEPLWYRAIISSALSLEQFAAQLAIPCAAILQLDDPAPAPQEQRSKPATTPASSAATSLRISVPLIDRMMELAGELALVRNQAVRSTDPGNAALRRLMRRLDSVTNELQDAALRMRMQPVGNLFDRFPRLVRDLARQLGKQIELEITGSNVELDKTVLETLADPLTHLVRNCCDHGIEMPEQRIGKGKPANGTIKLTARQDRGQIVIEVRDDGKGLDRDAIKRKALEQGIKRQQELESLSERQLYDLILLSGFSTASSVTDLSGRGVGMDVVKTNLDQIGGMVEIDSAVGRGTTFSLRLPLTLAIMPCLLLGSGGERYAIPQREVEEIVLIEPSGRGMRIECTQDDEVLRLRGSLVPLTRLNEVLSRREPFMPETRAEIIAKHHPAKSDAGRMYVAVLRVGSHRFGLVVDQVLESEDIVVKPLHPLLRHLHVFGAATILGDGGISLILSGEGIARHSGILHRPLPEALAAPQSASDSGQMHSIMLFRYGPSELLTMPMGGVRRVVMIHPQDIERAGDRELVNVDGAAVNVLRLDQLLNLSPFTTSGRMFLILPRVGSSSVGILVSEIVDTPTISLQIDQQAYKVDGVLGTVMIRGQIAIYLDLPRLLGIWQQMHAPDRGVAKQALLEGERKRILVVEDTQFFQKTIKSFLESQGFDITLAGNGAEALIELEGKRFDLIVSDIEMPVMDGFTFAQRAREDVRLGSIPMIALTTLNTEENRNKARQCGFDAYEVKLDRASLLATVMRLLKDGRAIATTQRAAAHE